jgi:hypothetical protein
MKVELVKQTDTDDGKTRWDVLTDGQWDSSWERKVDAQARIDRILRDMGAQS